MGRMFNARSIVFAALVVCAASCCAVGWRAGDVLSVSIAAVCAVLALTIGLTVHTGTEQKLIFLCMAAVALLAMAIGFDVRANQAPHPVDYGEVAEIRCVSNTAFDLSTNSCEVRYLTIDGKETEGTAVLVIRDAPIGTEDMLFGMRLRIANATVTTLFDPEKFDAGLYLDAPRYRIDADYGQVLYDGFGGANVFDRLRYRAANCLRAEMPQNTAGIAVALLFGDKTLLSHEDYAAFRMAGAAHALAVSGLHVGFLLLALRFSLGRLRRFRIPTFLLTAIVLFGYVAVCDGSVSVARAACMAILALSADLSGRREDGLNHLTICAVLFLAINPFLVCSLSFVMSFTSVLGIMMLAGPLNRGMRVCKLPEKIASPLAVGIAATLCVFPITAAYFHTFNVWSILINLIVLPIVTVAFLTELVCLPIALCGFGAVLTVPDYALYGLSEICAFFAALPSADYPIFSLGTGGLLFYAALVLIGEYPLHGSKLSRRIVCGTACVIAAAVLTVFNLPARLPSFGASAVQTGYSCAAVVCTNRATVVCTDADTYSYAELDRSCVDMRIRQIDVLVVRKYRERQHAQIERLVRRYGVGCVVLDYVEPLPADLRFDSVEALILTDRTLSVRGVELSSAIDSADVLILSDSGSVLAHRDGKMEVPYADCIVSRTAVDGICGVNLVTTLDEPSPAAVLAPENGLYSLG